MEIPLCGKVYDSAGVFCGELAGIQLDVKERKMTHFLVRDIEGMPARSVPSSKLATTSNDSLWLRCAERELRALERL